jgi:hypothetical protein
MIAGTPECYLPDFENNENAVNFFDNFERSRELSLYKGNKILLNRTGNETYAAFVPEKTYFSFDIFVIKSQENLAEFENLKITVVYQTFTAILNSLLANYYLQHLSLKRKGASFPKNNTQGIKDIPIPNFSLYPNLVAKISQKVSEISAIDFEELEKAKQKAASELKEQARKGKKNKQGTLPVDIFIGDVTENPKKTKTILDTYNTLKEEIDELVFELYDLDILEKQRIIDFFSSQKKITLTDKHKTDYQDILCECLEIYFDNRLQIELYDAKNLPTNLSCIVLYYGNKEQNPTPKQASQYQTAEQLLNKKTIFLSQQFLFGKNCVYILKENTYKYWTETAAFEDAQHIIKTLCKL